jgi:hypothetical protein
LPRARCVGFYQKTSDLAREAVNCNAVFGRIRSTVSLSVIVLA